MDKFCTKCNTTKAIEEFSRWSKAKDGKYYICRSCSSAYQRNKRLSNLEHFRARDKIYSVRYASRRKDYYFKTTYGITEKEYNHMLSSQHNKCAICGEEETQIHPRSGKRQTLGVDHCHKTGKIRDLLCHKCNKAIGLFDEKPDIIFKAYQYVNNWNGEEEPWD